MNYDIKIKDEYSEKRECFAGAEIKHVSITEIQIQKQLEERNNQNLFGDLVGKWPGDELWHEVIDNLDN